MAERKLYWTRENGIITVYAATDKETPLAKYMLSEIPNEETHEFGEMYGWSKLLDDRTSAEKDATKKVAEMDKIWEMFKSGDLKKAREQGERVSLKVVHSKLAGLTGKKLNEALAMMELLGVPIPEKYKAPEESK